MGIGRSTQMAGKRYTLVLNFGYVEQQRLSYMPWTSNQKFKDAKEALLDLALFLKERYLAENTPQLRKCCIASKENGASSFCAKCGLRLATEEPDGEEFAEWLVQLDTNVDGFHGLIEWDPDNRWQSDKLEGAPNQRFVYEAELVLTVAAGFAGRQDKTFEAICRNRTESQKSSFSYY
jgi:hypothetical protein